MGRAGGLAPPALDGPGSVEEGLLTPTLSPPDSGTVVVFSEQQGRRIAYERCAGWCEVCGIRPRESVHHRVKRGQGGLWTPSNLLATCGDGTRGCHGRIEAFPALSQAINYSLLSGADPTVAAVYLHTQVGVSWWRLDDDGMYEWVDPVEDVSDEERDALAAWLRAA